MAWKYSINKGGMRFHLVYSGPLSGSGNRAKLEEAARIRDVFHLQLKLLWETHTALKRLRQTAIVLNEPEKYLGTGDDSPFKKDRELAYAPADYETDLCAAIVQRGLGFAPLIRDSLSLNCDLDILFLRQEDPGSLVLQGGDLDNRIKTLLDALRMPLNSAEGHKFPPGQPHTYCLLESDSLVSAINVSTDRLLFPQSDRPNEVHLVIGVVVKVLKVGRWNICLV